MLYSALGVVVMSVTSGADRLHLMSIPLMGVGKA